MAWIVAIVIITIIAIAALFVEFETERDRKIVTTVIPRSIISLSWIAAVAAATVTSSIVIVDPGSVKIPIWFSSVQAEAYKAGVSFANPMYKFVEMDIRRDTIDFSDNKDVGGRENPVNGPAVLVQSADQNPLWMDISIPYSINPSLAWKLYSQVGKTDSIIEQKLLETSARTAIAEVVSKFPWEDVATKKRIEVSHELSERMKARVHDDLVTFGFTDAEANNAFIFPPAQIRQVKPDAKVLNSVAEKIATAQLRERQGILNEIAKLQVARRETEGEAIAKMFGALPKARASEIATILRAMAAKEMADATLKGVESGSVKVMVINGSDQPVSVPADAAEK